MERLGALNEYQTYFVVNNDIRNAMWSPGSADKADTLVKELDIEPTGGDKDGYPLKWRASLRGTYGRRVPGVQHVLRVHH